MSTSDHEAMVLPLDGGNAVEYLAADRLHRAGAPGIQQCVLGGEDAL